MNQTLISPIRLLQFGYNLLQSLFGRLVKFTCRHYLLQEDGETLKPWAHHAPNCLSLSRPLVLGPLLTLAKDQPQWVVLCLFVIMAATDLLDGMIARWLRCSSNAGAVLDPLCDKLFYGWCVLALLPKLPPSVSVYAIWVLKMEGCILTFQALGLIRLLQKSGKIAIEDVQSSILGKSKGFFEVAAFCAVLLGATGTAQACFVLALVAGIGSVPEYIINKLRRSKAANQK